MNHFGTFFLWALAACILCHGSLARDLRSGQIFLLQELGSNMCDNMVEAQNQGNSRDADIDVKAKLDRLEVKIGEMQAKQEEQLQEVEAKMEGHLQEVEAKLKGQLQEVQAQLEGHLQGVEAKLEGHLQGVEAKLEGQRAVLTKMDANLENIFLRLDSQTQAVLKKTENNLQAVSNKTEIAPSGFERIGTRYFRFVDEYVNWDTANRRCREMGGFLAAFQNLEEFNEVDARLNSPGSYWFGINDRETEGHYVSVASGKPAQFLKWEDEQANDKDHKKNCVAFLTTAMWYSKCEQIRRFLCQADNET